MQATYLYGPNDVRVDTVSDPVIKAPTDAIVSAVLSCVCGSDLHRYHSTEAPPAPRPMGHELLGRVEAIGADVRNVSVGDLVIASFAYQDNTCQFCVAGVQTSCLHGGFYGTPEVGGLQADLCRIPQADGSLVAVPKDVADAGDAQLMRSLLALSDVYLTGFHAAHKANVTSGQTVAVIGDGAVGLSAVLAAKTLGAERIILMGRHPSRIAIGKDFGATDIVSARGQEGIEAVMELTAGDGVNAVLECVGHLPAYEQAFAIVRPGGVVSRVGVPQSSEMPASFASLFWKNVQFTGGPAPVRAYMEPALKQVLRGDINPGKVFDVTLPLSQVAAGYAAMDDRSALKVALTRS